MASAKVHKKYTIVKRGVIRMPRMKNTRFGITSQQLYLGMIENKEKVVKSKRNVEYKASATSLDMDSLKRSYDDDQDEEYEDDGYGEYDEDETGYDSISESPSKKVRIDDDDTYRINRLNELDEKFPPSENSRSENRSENSRSENRSENSRSENSRSENSRSERNEPKSLSSIRENYQAIENATDEEKQKVIAQFSMIGKMYPNAKVPYVSMQTDLNFMKQEYETLIKNLKINDSQQRNKQILTMAFYAVEFLLGKFMKLNMAGFANEQLKNMDKYDRLLIEIGHKHYMPNAPERFPVEVRLLGLVLMQTALFIIVQKIATGVSNNMSSGAGGIFGLVSSFMSSMGSSDSKGSTTEKSDTVVGEPTLQSRMSGPNVAPVTTIQNDNLLDSIRTSTASRPNAVSMNIVSTSIVNQDKVDKVVKVVKET